jgi:hypothetical protein
MTPRRRPTLRRRLIIATTSLGLGLAALAALTGGARADTPTVAANKRFISGEELMAAGKVAEGCAEFEASNRIDPRAGTLIRIGQCREQLGQLASAFRAYQLALARVKDPKKRELAEARVAALHDRLSYLTITVAAANLVPGLAVTRDGVPIEPGGFNQPAPTDGGRYEIVALAPGRVAWQGHVVVPAEQGQVTIEVPLLLAPHVPTSDHPDAARPKAPAVATVEPAPWTARRKAALGLGLGGAVVAVVGGIVGHTATGRRDQARALCADPAVPCADAAEATSLSSSAHGLAIDADLLFAVAVAAELGAGVLWLTGAPSEHAIAVTPVVGADRAGVVVRGSF